MAGTKETEKLKKEIEMRSGKGHGVNFDNFTPLQVLEQIAMFLGIIVFLGGFWMLVYRLIKHLL